MLRAALILIAVTGLVAPAAADPRPTCPRATTIIHVDTRAHQLRLCENGREVAIHRVAIGSAGPGKRRQGDKKTPSGSYALGKPRPSARFLTFIPVGYPTAEQSARGYTGSLIGIHGPSRSFAWAGKWSVYVDWTQGCIAVGSDAEIAAIVRWLARSKASRVVIE